MSGLRRMGVKLLEIQFASDQENDGAHGCKSGVAPRLTFGRLEQPVEGFEKAIGLAGLTHATIPSKCCRIIRATVFIGSTLDRITCVHH